MVMEALIAIGDDLDVGGERGGGHAKRRTAVGGLGWLRREREAEEWQEEGERKLA
jgi:hypothetical protein